MRWKRKIEEEWEINKSCEREKKMNKKCVVKNPSLFSSNAFHLT